MHIRYETTLATLVQFVIGTSLTFVSGLASILGGCRNVGGVDCVSNTFVSLLLIILVIAGYGFLLALGYVAQDRRSSRLAVFLIVCELFAGLIFLFDAKQAPSLVERATNGLSFVIVLWVCWVAFNLYRARGARIVRRKRT